MPPGAHSSHTAAHAPRAAEYADPNRSLSSSPASCVVYHQPGGEWYGQQHCRGALWGWAKADSQSHIQGRLRRMVGSLPGTRAFGSLAAAESVAVSE